MFIDPKTTTEIQKLTEAYHNAQAAGWLAAGLQPLIDRQQQAAIPELEAKAEAAKIEAERIEAATRADLQSADGETRTAAYRRYAAATQTAQAAARSLREAQGRLEIIRAAQRALEQAAVLPDVAEALARLDLRVAARPSEP